MGGRGDMYRGRGRGGYRGGGGSGYAGGGFRDSQQMMGMVPQMMMRGPPMMHPQQFQNFGPGHYRRGGFRGYNNGGGPRQQHPQQVHEGQGISKKVYVGQIDYRVQWFELKDLFRPFGDVQYADVPLDMHGYSKGYGVVELATPEEAQNAVRNLNGLDWFGRRIVCREYREDTPLGGSHGNNQGDGDNQTKLYVGGLPYSTNWRDLKNLFGTYGTVTFADVLMTHDGRSKGTGTVFFSDRDEALAGMEALNGSDLYGRKIEVRLWVENYHPQNNANNNNANNQENNQQDG